MKAILLYFLFGLSLNLATAQNLVRNPSLEELRKGVVGYRGVSGTPDIASVEGKVIQYPPYFNAYQSNSPTRFVSNITFGDVCLCQWFSYESSELTQVELVRPLKKNREYVVSLYTIRASTREPPVSEVTVYFTKKPLPATREVYGLEDHPLTSQRIPYLPLTTAPPSPLASRETWTKVSGVYRAEGGERYLTIGNFIGANEAALAVMNSAAAEDTASGKIKGTYYCYDNISVVLKPDAEQEPVLVSAEPETIPVANPFAFGNTITLGDVNFTSGDHHIREVAFPTLDSLTAFMQAEPEAVVHIAGHTDSVGTEADNLDLSIRRAQAVQEYLINSGISAERISFTGLGERMPKVDNRTEESRALNRRVEILIRRSREGFD
jgi:outer membrane protein OmpA-like peptidoglycan-associated protein